MFRRTVCALVLGASSLAAQAEMYRCAAAGRVSYQDFPCGEAATADRLDIPTRYPAPNLSAREQLLAREAALDKRLEARREREMQLLALREAQQAREAERERAVAAAAAAAAAQPQWILVGTPYRARHPRLHPRSLPARPRY